MPPKLNPGGSGFSTLLKSAFNPSEHEVDEDDALQIENEPPDGANKSEVFNLRFIWAIRWSILKSSYVRLQMTVYEKQLGWSDASNVCLQGFCECNKKRVSAHER